MDIQIVGITPSKKEIWLYDITPIKPTLPETIHTYTMTISSAKIPNTVAEIDVIAYLTTNRVKNELYVINSELLGLGSNQIIPDGVYTIDVNINNQYIKQFKFLQYQTIKEKVVDMLNEANYDVEITNYGVTHVGDSIDSEYDINEARIAKNLLDMLENYTQIPDEVEVNNTIDKLERILTIIKK